MKDRRKTLNVIVWLALVAAPLAFSEQIVELKTPRPIEISDIPGWKGVGAMAVSPDGGRLAYTVSSRDGYHELIIRKTRERKDIRLSTAASELVFSPDSRWLAFAIRPDSREVRRLAKQNKKAYNRVGLVEVDTSAKKEFDKIQRFSFAGEKTVCLVLHAYPPEAQEKAAEKSKGSTLLLYDPVTARELSLGNVSDFAVAKSGKWLAWLIDAWEQRGNGVHLRNMETGQILSLDSGPASYEALAWTKKGDGLIALKGKDEKDSKERHFSIVGASGFSGSLPEAIVYDPGKDPAFPRGMAISPNRKPRWTDDLDGFLFGIQAGPSKTSDSKGQKAAKVDAVEDEELPDLVLWHWRDKRIPPQQLVEEKKDREANDLCVYWIKDGRFVRLGDESLRDVVDAPGQRWAVGFDSRAYDYLNDLTGVVFTDLHAVDMRTGERRLASQKHPLFSRPRWTYSFSPDGRRLLFYRDGHFHTFTLESGQTVNITAAVPASFVNLENTYFIKDPPIQPLGWDKSGTSVLLSDNWDIWKVPASGGPGVNLTVSGKKDGIRFQQLFQLDPEAEGVDLSAPLYIRMYGEWTKKSGIARIDQGRAGPKILLWEDAVFNYLTKAEKAEAYFYAKETFEDDNLYLSDHSLQNGIPMYDIEGLNKEFLWSSGVRLIDYTSIKGDKLQAALFLPADYEEGKSYPTVVSIYEKLSSWLNRYFGPGYGGLSTAICTSQGYAILMPDILNRVEDPVLSALWCVVPAVEAAIAAGIVDRERIGLTGHSMGGWETAFLITQTDLFKAAVAGAPLTDLISMYGSVYGRTGQSNAPLFERSQARMATGYWENLDVYLRNSPIFFAQNVKTPLLIMHNDKDGAVDFNQGVEFFNVLRRLQKPVVMLQYKGEDHGLTRRPNQKDYTIRMMEFFDHYLRDKPAPPWLQEGVPLLRMEEHLKERVKIR